MPKWFIGPNVWSDKVMSPTEAAYIAGFIDGEGTIGITKSRRKENVSGFRMQPYLSIANTNITALEAIQVMCGNGRLIQCTNPQKPTHKPGYLLRFMPNQMRHVLPQILPYLLIKQRQANYLMEFLAVNRNGRNKTQERIDSEQRLRDAVCGLNARGVRVQ